MGSEIKSERAWRVRSFCRFFFSLSLVALQIATAAETKAQSATIAIAYTSLSPQFSPVWIAKETHIFEKSKLAADLVYIRGAVAASQALVGGDVSIISAGVGAVVDASLGGADLVVLASPSNRAESVLVAKHNIKSPAELKGKKIAVGSLAGPALLSLKAILKSYGLNPEKDVQYVVTGPTAARFAALNSSVIDATLLEPPFTLHAKKAGYSFFENLPALKEIAIANASIISTRKFVEQQPWIVEQVVKSVIQGIHFYKTNVAGTVAILKKYSRIESPEDLQEFYQRYLSGLVEKPYPSIQSVKTFLAWSKNPKAKTSDPKLFVDSRFVEKLDREGFIDALYRR